MIPGTRYNMTEYGLAEELVGLGAAAILMYLLGREVCASTPPDGTDGYLSAKDVRVILARLDLPGYDAEVALGELETSGRWLPIDGEDGHRDHRYLLANRSIEQRETGRKRAAKKQADYRAKLKEAGIDEDEE